jgi:hypothetical protein
MIVYLCMLFVGDGVKRRPQRRSVLTCACPAWLLTADTHHLKLQHVQNKVLRTIGNASRYTADRDLHTAFNLPSVYSYITKLCSQQAEVIQNHENGRLPYWTS